VTKTSIYSNEPIFAIGLQYLMSGLDGFEQPAICPTWEELLVEAARSGSNHVIIVDTTAADTLEKLAILTTTAPNARLVLWAQTISVEFLSQAVALGVRGILRKGGSAKCYIECLCTIASGKMWMDTLLARKVHTVKRTQLRRRERELMALLARGLTNKELASRMKITNGTVNKYLTHLYQKIGASDRFELALIALRNLTAYQTDTSSQGAASNRGPGVMPRYLIVDGATVHGKRRGEASTVQETS
jgi:two-component system nitrate/nitrite response regulator NarL